MIAPALKNKNQRARNACDTNSMRGAFSASIVVVLGPNTTWSLGGKGIPPAVVTTGGNIADITAAEDLVEAIPAVAGRRGRPRKRPDAILADKGYDSRRFRESLQANGIMPVIPKRDTKGIIGLGKIRWVDRTHHLLAPPVQTPRHPLGTPHRPPQRTRIPRLRPHLPETTQQNLIGALARVFHDVILVGGKSAPELGR